MKYLRVIISTEARGPLYQKDFDPANVFDLFVRSFVTELVRDGTIRQGEHYIAVIIPRYGQYLRRHAVLSVDQVKAVEERPWISLEFEDPLQPEAPLAFFTLELRVRERSLIFRADFQWPEIGYFWRSLEQALLGMGVLHDKEYYWYRFYARDDGQAEFEREELFGSQADLASLVEIGPAVSAMPAFPARSLGDFGRHEVREMPRGGMRGTNGSTGSAEPTPDATVQALIARPALEDIQHIARSGVQVEQGGMLVGYIYTDAAGPGYLVQITDYIPAEGALSHIAELRYTFESWQRRTTLLKERFPGKRIVGWYHTHLVQMEFYTDDSRQATFATSLFFSRDDIFMHRQFFREKWYVAMVLDPQGNAAFFQWTGDQIQLGRRFYVIEPAQEG